jgi:hypothetical protein
MSRIHEMVDATASNDHQNASTGLKEYQMTAIRPATKAVGLLDGWVKSHVRRAFLRDLAW